MSSFPQSKALDKGLLAAVMLVSNIIGNGILLLGWLGVSPLGVTGSPSLA